MGALLFGDRYELSGQRREGRLHVALSARRVDTGADVELWLPHEALAPTAEARARVVDAARAQAAAPLAGTLPILDADDDERLYVAVPASRPPTLPVAALDQAAGLPAVALTLARRLAPILDAAHRRDVVHGYFTARDLAVHDGALVIAGLGLWRAFDPRELLARLGDDTPLSPEVRAGIAPTAATDVWSLAALCVRLCVGAAPMAMDALAHAYPRVNSALAPALTASAAQRPGSCRELVAELEIALVPRRFPRGTNPPPITHPQVQVSSAPSATPRRPPPPPPRRKATHSGL